MSHSLVNKFELIIIIIILFLQNDNHNRLFIRFVTFLNDNMICDVDKNLECIIKIDNMSNMPFRLDSN